MRISLTLPVSKSLKTAKTITLAAAQSSHNQSTAVIKHSENTALNKYIRNIRAMNKKTAYEYNHRLNNFQDFVIRSYTTTLDQAVEALSIRIKDLHLETRPSKIYVRGEYTKTKTDRYVFLTEEAVNQLKQWLEYKYRTRRVCHKDINSEGKTISYYKTPERNDNDLIFAVYQDREHANPKILYFDLAKSFGKTLDRMGKALREESNNNRRRQITLHSFRRFVKTTVSDLGYSDYSEWFIGHAGSTYSTRKDSEKADIFRKIEPYLTFLNVHQLERRGADIQSKVEELEQLNQSMRDRDKMKDDAIAHLSDQLIALTSRLQEVERRQQV